MNPIVYFEIQSSNPARDINFYQAIFGWTFTPVEGLPIEYYQIQTENMSGGLLKRPAAIPHIAEPMFLPVLCWSKISMKHRGRFLRRVVKLPCLNLRFPVVAGRDIFLTWIKISSVWLKLMKKQNKKNR